MSRTAAAAAAAAEKRQTLRTVRRREIYRE